MKYTNEQIGGVFTAVGLLVFFTVKFWSTSVLLIFDNFFIRLAVLLLLVLSIKHGMIPATIVLIAVIMIFYERNQRKVAAITQMTGGGYNHGNSAEALKSIEGDVTAPQSAEVIVPAMEYPELETVQFLPKTSQQSNSYDGAGREPACDTVPLGAASGAVWNKVANAGSWF